MSKRICGLFSLLGFVSFWVIVKVARRTSSWSTSEILQTKSHLMPFQRPQPHLLPEHATLAQVNKYVNVSRTLGSMRYEESAACKKYSTCDIHFSVVENLDVKETTRRFVNAHGRTDFAVLTLKGFKQLVTDAKENQDRTFLISPMEFSEESPLPTGTDDFMLALFDGHGTLGHGTSHFAAMEMPPTILENMKRNKDSDKDVIDGVTDAIKDSFLDLDRKIPYLEASGSTGIVILRVGSHLFMASTGDSEAFLVKVDTTNDNLVKAVTIVQSTIPHKPEDPVEFARIQASGGTVIPKSDMDSSSRVVIPLGDGSTMALAMSRCLGDPEGKNANLVISDPNVDAIDLKELRDNDASTDQYFVMVASDGLWDRIEPLDVAKRMARSFYFDSRSQPLEACRQLIQASGQMWAHLDAGMGATYRDDITLAAKKISI